jgi:leucyl/phenylalanyl-tRNA--protein transferase
MSPIYRLGPEPVFPPVEEADPSGLLAVGGDLAPERLLEAYAKGIFPWYDDDQPILWHAPDPRMVLLPSELRVSRSLARSVRRRPFELKLDTAFEPVMRACAEAPRPGAGGTWITSDMIEAYVRLHHMGFAHSTEAWDSGELVGGLYGVSLGGTFFGESMFARRSDASKVAFVALVRQLEAWDFDLVDCQMYTEHLARFGAVERPRSWFSRRLAASLEKPTRRGAWSFEHFE